MMMMTMATDPGNLVAELAAVLVESGMEGWGGWSQLCSNAAPTLPQRCSNAARMFSRGRPGLRRELWWGRLGHVLAAGDGLGNV